ncbi:MAG: SAP domain-containing protein [Candidatus Methanoplasma sp.]|jgi:hypothetical protein|nr:SAP domain-containing protein [Candidatus Methanoplasma sp.]
MTSPRPELSVSTSAEEFQSFYYLKEELVRFCRTERLQTSGGKVELAERISIYLETGERASVRRKRVPRPQGEVSSESVIGPDIVFSEGLRTFFESVLGPKFKFTVGFQRWLKDNPDRTYGDAIEAYGPISKAKNVEIGRQFEYNSYIRAFFADNAGLSLNDAIRCWRHKKGLGGHNRYERGDLVALNCDG